MIFKQLLEKLIRFIKNRFGGRVAVDNDELSRIADAIDRFAYTIKHSCGTHEKIVETTIAFRYIKVMRECITAMMITAEPDVFSVKYHDACIMAEKVYGFKCIDKKARMIISDITDMLSRLSDPAEDCADDELVYYSVTFGGRRKEYYYLSDGKGYKEGQYVLVPVGVDMQHKIAKIVGIDRFTRTNAPMPPDELKVIISRAIEKPSF